MSVTIQYRRSAAAAWTAANPVLAQGEAGLETDTGKAKMGDGTTAWASLPYWQPAGASGGAVASVFGRTGTVTAQSGDYGVGQVTGAAPLASPTLTGTPAAPTASALTSSTQVATTAYADAAVAVEAARAEAAEALRAPLASPALTGTPTAPTKAPLTDSTAVATTAYADAAVAVETARAETAEALAYPRAGGALGGALAPRVTTLTDAATVAIDASQGNHFRLLCTTGVGASRQLGTPTGLLDGEVITIDVIQPASGGPCTLTYSGAYTFGGGSAPALSTAASARDTLGFRRYAPANLMDYQGSGLGFAS